LTEATKLICSLIGKGFSRAEILERMVLDLPCNRIMAKEIMNTHCSIMEMKAEILSDRRQRKLK